MPQTSRVFAAEVVGTALLMLGGPGSAILAGNAAGGGIGKLGVALAFGFSLLVAAYVVGPISGCHINPAVTVGMVLTRKTPVSALPTYIVGQLVGAAIGGGIIFAIANGVDGFDASRSGFATNGWADRSPGGYNFGAMAVVEIVFTAVLVFVVLSTTGRKFTAAQGGLVAGLTLALIHLVTIPVDNTSVNPARSVGAVLWSGNSDAWQQLWAFLVLPIIGAFVGVLVWLALDDSRLEDTLLDTKIMTAARDAASEVASDVTQRLVLPPDEDPESHDD